MSLQLAEVMQTCVLVKDESPDTLPPRPPPKKTVLKGDKRKDVAALGEKERFGIK